MVASARRAETAAALDQPGWLLLSYQIPRTPSAPYMSAYRRLKALRVLHINSGFAALPDRPGAEVDLRAVAAHINQIWGATASLLRASAMDGCEHLVTAYNVERDVEYAEIIAACEDFLSRGEETPSSDDLKKRRQLARIARRFEEATGRDVFGASRRDAAERALGGCRMALLPA